MPGGRGVKRGEEAHVNNWTAFLVRSALHIPDAQNNIICKYIKLEINFRKNTLSLQNIAFNLYFFKGTVHKRENFFGADFGFLSKLSFLIIKWMFFTKKKF